MKPEHIHVGDMLRLKPHNQYGLGPAVMVVTAVQERSGYKTPWIRCDGYGHFRPSDFAGKVTL